MQRSDFLKRKLHQVEDGLEIAVPVYNEGENIVRLYEQLLASGVEFSNIRFIYDFDQDTTVPYIDELAKEDERVRADRNKFGRGVVNALRWAFLHCGNGPVVVVMGDCSDKLSILSDMIKLWDEGAIIVSPSRYSLGGKQHGGGFIKKTLSRIAGLSLGVLGVGTHDATNNFKLYDGLWLKKQKIESRGGFEVALELVYKAFRDGKKISELPTEWFDRTEGESNFKIVAWLPGYLKWYLKCFLVAAKRAIIP